MLRADRRGTANRRQSPSSCVRCNLQCPLGRLLTAIPFVMLLATMGGAAPAAGQSCTGLVACQSLDQENLLAYFNTLTSVPGGRALLDANMKTEESIYLNANQGQKTASGTVFILPLLPANLLIRACP